MKWLFLFAKIFFFTGLILWSACTDFSKNSAQEESMWVWAVFDVKTSTDSSGYYYYGEIDKSLYNKMIKNKKIRGIIELRNIRYWTNEDKLNLMEDEFDEGTYLFKIQDLKKLEQLKMDPIYQYPKEKLSESAIEYKKNHPRKRTTQKD